MGFFSFKCNGCGHPMLSKYASNHINQWMEHVVLVTKSKIARIGYYDGYGRVDDQEFSWYESDDKLARRSVWHFACWAKAGHPHDVRRAKSADDQGFFFDDPAHDMECPLTDEELKKAREKFPHDVKWDGEKWVEARPLPVNMC